MKWPPARLRDVCQLVGETLLPTEHPSERFAHYSIPAFDDGTRPAIELGASILSTKLLIPRGVVLFSKLNPRISRVWYVADDVGARRICSTEFLPLLPRPDILDAHYLTFALREDGYVNAIRRRVQAATKSRERLPPELVLDSEVPLPPLAEQRRIAARLTEQLAAVERARRAAQERVEAGRALRKAMTEDVLAASAKWPAMALGDLCGADGQYGISAKGSHVQDGVPILRMGNIIDGEIDWTELQFVQLGERDIAKYRLRPGDLLFNRTNSAELVGKSAIFEDDRLVVFASYLIRFRLRADLADPHFVCAFINSRGGRRFIEANMGRAIGQVNISASTMSRLRVPIPSIQEQRAFSRRLREWSSRADAVEASAQAELAAIEALPAALLREAFEGVA